MLPIEIIKQHKEREQKHIEYVQRYIELMLSENETILKECMGVLSYDY